MRGSVITLLPNRPRRQLLFVAALGAAQVLAGCSIFGKSPTSIEGKINASADINVGELKHPSPVVVRIYELKQSAAFEAADFLALFQREQETLGPDLVGRKEYVLQPGHAMTLERRSLSDDTHAMGVVAAFQNVERATWRAMIPVRLNHSNIIQVRLDGMVVTATVQK